MWIAEGLHRTASGHVVPAGAVVPGLRSADPDATLAIGHGATVQGGIDHAGAVVLAPRASAWHDVRGGHEVVLGPGATVRGRVTALGRIVVQAGASAGDLDAGGDVLLLGDCRVGAVRAAGDIIIVGAPTTGLLQPGGRISTRPW